jgi:hypothetical protein
MFIPFFLELKAEKIPVTLREFLSLIDPDCKRRPGNCPAEIAVSGRDFPVAAPAEMTQVVAGLEGDGLHLIQGRREVR